MADKLKREFRVSQATLTEHAKIVKINLQENLADFTDFDRTIDESTLQRIDDLITQSGEKLSDSVITDQQSRLTEIVKEKLKECREHYHTIMFFVKKAFPNSISIRNEFGENNYGNIRDKQKEMILFMNELHLVAQKYKAELLSAGAKQEYIDRIYTLYKELDTANNNQELFKGNRPVLTDQRNEVLNELWKALSLIGQAAAIIYRNDFSKMKQFLLPSRTSSVKDAVYLIEAGGYLTAIEAGVSEDMFLKLENKGEADLFFYTAESMTDGKPDSGINVKAGTSEIVKTNDISIGSFGKLFVLNESNSAGKYSISIME